MPLLVDNVTQQGPGGSPVMPYGDFSGKGPAPDAGFDFDVTVGCRFMALAGSLTGISVEDGVEIVVRVYDATTGALLLTFDPETTDAEGYLPRMTDPALSAATEYTLMAVWPDGDVYAWNMVAT